MNSTAFNSGMNGHLGTWVWALLGTLALNLVLFAAIPNLMKPTETVQSMGPMIPQIQLTRLRRAKIEPKQREQKPPPKVQPKKLVTRPRMNRPALQHLSLPFEINHRLAPGSATLDLPEMMSKSLDNLPLSTLFSPGDLDQPLTVLSRIPPVYPFRAKTRGIEGWVAVEFTVTEEGRVKDIEILEAKPETIFNQSVIQCLTAWRFKPGRVGGEAVQTRVRTRIRFELN